jgi:hypothetical protein
LQTQTDPKLETILLTQFKEKLCPFLFSQKIETTKKIRHFFFSCYSYFFFLFKVIIRSRRRMDDIHKGTLRNTLTLRIVKTLDPAKQKTPQKKKKNEMKKIELTKCLGNFEENAWVTLTRGFYCSSSLVDLQ